MEESNEKIVENLTHDLEQELNVTDHSEKVKESNPETEAEDFDDDGFEESEALLRLQEQETTLSAEEKEELRSTALSKKEEGNAKFRENLFEDASRLYTEALHCCPLLYEDDRSVLYNNRAAAHAKLGNKDRAIADCGSALELKPTYVKAIARRAKLYEGTDKLDEALADYKKVLELDPQHQESQEAVRTLPARIDERNEKLKSEMFGKLKDLGNLVLRPFGLSTDNFQVNKDPNTGSFSISMKQ